MKNKSIMDCLKPKRGKKLELPCDSKIKALKFLVEAYEVEHQYDEVDFEDEMYKVQCHHDFKVDREEEYERKLLKCIKVFREEIPVKSRE